MESLVVLPDLTESQRILPLQSKLGHGWCSLQFFESEAFLGAVDEEDKSELEDEVLWSKGLLRNIQTANIDFFKNNSNNDNNSNIY